MSLCARACARACARVCVLRRDTSYRVTTTVIIATSIIATVVIATVVSLVENPAKVDALRHRPAYELRAYVNQYICKLFFCAFFAGTPTTASTPFFFLFRYLCLSFFDYRTYTTRSIVTCCVFCLIFNNYGTRSRGTGRRLGNNSSFSRGDVMCAGELSRLPLFLFYRFCIVCSFSFLSYPPSTFTILSFVVSRSMKKQPSAHGRMHRWKACRLGILSWLPSWKISTLCSAACVYLCIVVVVNIFLLLIMAIVMVKSGDAVAFFLNLFVSSPPLLLSCTIIFFMIFLLLFFLFAVCLFRRGTVESSFYLYFIPFRLFCKDDPLHKFFHRFLLLLPVCLCLNGVLAF